MFKKFIIIICIVFFLGSVFYILGKHNSSLEQNKITEITDQNIDNNQEKTIENNNSLDDSNSLEDSNITINEDYNQNNKKQYYFAYGSNMDISLLRKRINNIEITPVSYAILREHLLIFPRGVGSVIFNKETDVYGCLYLLTQEEIEKLDVVEGYKENRDKNLNSYNREWIEVETKDGEKILALIYIQTKNTIDKPSTGYKETLITGAKDCQLPKFYQKYLEEIETK